MGVDGWVVTRVETGRGRVEGGPIDWKRMYDTDSDGRVTDMSGRSEKRHLIE